MTVWYTADLHLGHRNIIKYCDRPWPDLSAMHEALVARWNARVTPEDTVWLLGDVAMSAEGLEVVERLAGHKILVAGNHDACWDGHRKPRLRDRYLQAGFSALVTSGEVAHHQVGDHRVKLAHFPYRGDHTDTDRHADRRPVDDGHTPLLHGHVHRAWRTQDSQINVGVDVWDYAPVSEATLAALLDELAPSADPTRRAPGGA